MSLPYTFERDLYRAVARFKRDHPGVLEARTQQRKAESDRKERDHDPKGMDPAN